jgi:hypothetical protein
MKKALDTILDYFSVWDTSKLYIDGKYTFTVWSVVRGIVLLPLTFSLIVIFGGVYLLCFKTWDVNRLRKE